MLILSRTNRKIDILATEISIVRDSIFSLESWYHQVSIVKGL
jgi:hypothetical protein